MIIYEGTLDRFGYELKVLCKTEEECINKLLKEYVTAFKRENDGVDPRKEIAYDRHSDLTYYEEAKEDIIISEYEIGKVDWC